MTNEEKAREIVDKELNAPITLANRHQAEFSLEGHCEKVALEMAEWKDHQFKEYLEKKKAELVTQIKHSTGECFPYVMYMTMVDKIINELFKEN